MTKQQERIIRLKSAFNNIIEATRQLEDSLKEFQEELSIIGNLRIKSISDKVKTAKDILKLTGNLNESDSQTTTKSGGVMDESNLSTDSKRKTCESNTQECL